MTKRKKRQTEKNNYCKREKKAKKRENKNNFESKGMKWYQKDPKRLKERNAQHSTKRIKKRRKEIEREKERIEKREKAKREGKIKGTDKKGGERRRNDRKRHKEKREKKNDCLLFLKVASMLQTDAAAPKSNTRYPGFKACKSLLCSAVHFQSVQSLSGVFNYL